MTTTRLALVLTSLAWASACGGAQTPASVARSSVEVADTAWLVAASACVAVTDPAARAKCGPPLLVAHKALLAAASAVDANGADYACDLVAVSSSLSLVGSFVTLPASVTTAQTFTAGLSCPDAGTISDGGISQ